MSSKDSVSKISLSSFDDLFHTDESREDLKKEKLTEIPLTKIQKFPDHPYQVKDDESMDLLVDSIKSRGLIQPVLVRPVENGMYEMVSGHRRKRAFELIGIDKIPARVQELTRDEAILSMVDSNLQREEILPSEKAFAYKMKIDAAKRQGLRSDLTFSPVGKRLNTYEAQIAYYTEAIAKNPRWSFAGVYADEGITGTATDKRKDFLRLMNDCEKGKIDMILTKSISRFARNTVDSLSWVRKLRAMNIGVYFEEQAIDSLKAENEMLIGLFSVIAQAESENISANVKWGIQQSMKNGKYCSNFSCYGYKRGADGIPEIVPEQAEVIKMIFDRYLDGYSLEQIQKELLKLSIKTYTGKAVWDRKQIKDILQNEKYVGDLLLQKTYRANCLNKKSKTNKGELPKYLVSNNHPAIIEREKFNLVQMEIARRGSTHKKSGKAKTEQGKYSSKFVLSELLVCGECGGHYKRNGKTNKNGDHLYYWRCITRAENGKRSCSSNGIEEQKLHATICKCLNKMFSCKYETLKLLKNSLQYAVSGSTASLDVYAIEKQIAELKSREDIAVEMLGKTDGNADRYLEEIKKLEEQISALRNQKEIAKAMVNENSAVNQKIKEIETLFASNNLDFKEFDDIVIRRLVECIRVLDNKIIVILKGGIQAEESL